ncbi:MAG: hypothetical protein V8S87_04775 [Oscillospiraceae bacterium]
MSENNLYIRDGLLEKFEFQSYGHALEILNGAFQTEWNEIQDSLERLMITTDELREAGMHYFDSLMMFYTHSAGGKYE